MKAGDSFHATDVDDANGRFFPRNCQKRHACHRLSKRSVRLRTHVTRDAVGSPCAAIERLRGVFVDVAAAARHAAVYVEVRVLLHVPLHQPHRFGLRLQLVHMRPAASASRKKILKAKVTTSVAAEATTQLT